jgi:phage anti-repressor protein
VDQKYEKVGTLTSLSQNYDQEEKALYDLIKQEQIMIQFEQRAGLVPARQLNIALGVVPDKFDSTIEALRKIGELKSIQIDKNDKTNEYKKLEAERLSLQKARDTLLELRQKDASTADLISLTNQLLDVEKQIQALGVSLGDFDANNEFCTVKFSLKERRADKVVSISFLQRAKVALEWAAGVYFMFWLVLFLGLGSLWLLVSLIEKVQRWNAAAK